MARFRLLLFYFAERPCDASLLPYSTDSQSTPIYSWLKRSHLGAPPFRLTDIWIPIAESRSHNRRSLLQNILKAENSNQIQIHWDQYQMFSLNKEETGSGSIYSYCGLFSIAPTFATLPSPPPLWSDGAYAAPHPPNGSRPTKSRLSRPSSCQTPQHSWAGLELGFGSYGLHLQMFILW